MQPQLGEQFGAYKLVSSLGSGGFATVWLGEHTIIGTKAAIKILNMQLPEDEQQQQQYLDEARTTARLDHPNIVRVLDCNIQKNALFLVLAYAPNGTLRDRHPKGTRVSLPDVVSYTKQIAAGLQYAHDKRLIHCDVKPANMLLGPNHEIWLSDFGVAIVAHSIYSMPLPKLEQHEVMGTAAYMAPEQFIGKPVAASDQYALGVVIYEWLSGKLPFNGTANDIAMQQQVVTLSLRDKVPGLSPAVEEVILKALKVDLKERFANVQDFAEALEQAANIPYQILPEEPQPTNKAKPDSQQLPGDNGAYPSDLPPTIKENMPPEAIPVNPLPNKDGSPLIETQPAIIQPEDKEAPRQEELPQWPNFPPPPKSPSHDAPTEMEAQPAIIQPEDKGAPQEPKDDWWKNPPPPPPNSPLHNAPTEKAPPPEQPMAAGKHSPPPPAQPRQYQIHLDPFASPPPFAQPRHDQIRLGPSSSPPPVPEAEPARPPRKRLFDPYFYRSSKNGFFLYAGIVVDISIALLLFFWLVRDTSWSPNAGNVLLLSPIVLVIVRGFCASALRKHIAQPFAWILALSWGLAAYALIHIVRGAENLWALIFVFIFLGWLFQDFLYASRKPRSTR